jgi:NADH-quinone oxidoreductase subunit F
VAAAVRHFRHEFEWHVRQPKAATKPGAVYRGDAVLA